MGVLSFECACGHVEEEHEGKFFQPCTIDGCPCEDFEGVE